jgi:hypothetical protein
MASPFRVADMAAPYHMLGKKGRPPKRAPTTDLCGLTFDQSDFFFNCIFVSFTMAASGHWG